MKQSSGWQPKKPQPPLKYLDKLIGEWDMVASHPSFPTPVHGHVSMEWLEEEALLVMRSEYERPGPPSAVAVIGGDNSLEAYSMLYFDERGVSRIYQMRFEDGVWKLWREAPGFNQRFTGTFGDNGNTITGRWESSGDGSIWEPDLEVIYSKSK